MSVDYRGFAAIGFKITAEEVSHLSEEDYEYLLDENRLILLNSYTSKSDYIFIKDGSYKSADEGDTTSILSLYRENPIISSLSMRNGTFRNNIDFDNINVSDNIQPEYIWENSW